MLATAERRPELFTRWKWTPQTVHPLLAQWGVGEDQIGSWDFDLPGGIPPPPCWCDVSRSPEERQDFDRHPLKVGQGGKSIPRLLRMHVEFCQILFSAPLVGTWLFFFSLLKWWVRRTGFWMMNQPWILGINPTWLWCISVYCWIWLANILLRTFTNVYQCYWPVIFLSTISLSGFLIKVMLASQNEFGSVPCSEFFFNILRGIRVNYSLNVW